MQRYRNRQGGVKCFAIVAFLFAFLILPALAFGFLLPHKESPEDIFSLRASTLLAAVGAFGTDLGSIAGDFATDVWCDVTGFFGFSLCEKTPPSIVVAPPPQPSTTSYTVTTTIPPPPEEARYYTASTTPEGRVVYATVVEEHNTYVTNPTTIIREGSGGSGNSNGVSLDLFHKQVDSIYDSMGNAADGVRDDMEEMFADIAASFTTAILSVTGNASVGGNLDVVGTLTAGSLSVTSVSSGGAVEAPYFTATSSTASTFPYASSTAISVSGTASTTNLSAQTATIGTVTITTISVTSTLDASTTYAGNLTATNATSTNFFATNASTTNATSTNLFTNNFTLGSLTGFLKATAGSIATALVNLTTDITGTLGIGNGGTGATTLNDLITLGTHTVGNYVATITGNSQIAVSGSGSETAGVTLSINADSVDDTQLAFNTGQDLTTASSPTFVKTTVTNASSTNISSTYASSTSGFFGSLSIGALSGVLKATAGAISAAAVNLASEVSGVLAVANGGTGWASIASGFIPFGNGGSALATSTALSFDGTKFITTYASTTALTVSGNTYLATSGGNVGIGTTTPSAKLSLTGDFFLDGAVTTIKNVTNGGALALYGGGGGMYFGGSFANHMFLSSTGNVGIGTTTPQAQNGFSGVLSLSGSAPSFTLDRGAGTVQWHIGQDTSNNLRIIRDGAVNVLTANTSGNVGIGTTTPVTPLNVHATARNNGISITGDSSSGIGLNIRNYQANGRNWNIFSAGTGNIDATSGQLSFYDETAGAFRMVIDSVGDVGIGATDPLGVKLAISNAADNDTLLSLNVGANGRLAFSTDSSANVQALTQNNVDFRLGVGSADDLVIKNGGNIGIGTTNPDNGKLEVKGGTVCVDTNSDDNASSCIANESDERLKTNIQDLTGSLDTLRALRSVSFDWRTNDPEVVSHYPLISRFEGNEHSIGLIAQEVKLVLPEALATETVGDDEVQYFQLDYTKFIPVIINAVQELYDMVVSRFAAQDANNAGQAAAIEALEARVQELEAQNGIQSPSDEEPTDDSSDIPPETPDESLGGGEIPPDTEEESSGGEELNAPNNVGTETPEQENPDDGEASEPSPEPPPSE